MAKRQVEKRINDIAIKEKRAEDTSKVGRCGWGCL